jgi:hypothetical protein
MVGLGVLLNGVRPSVLVKFKTRAKYSSRLGLGLVRI